jgi:hypothetical protein
MMMKKLMMMILMLCMMECQDGAEDLKKSVPKREII